LPESLSIFSRYLGEGRNGIKKAKLPLLVDIPLFLTLLVSGHIWLMLPEERIDTEVD